VGVIILYTSEDDRLDVAIRASKYLKLQLPKYWKAHSARYSRNGIKASDFAWAGEDATR